MLAGCISFFGFSHKSHAEEASVCTPTSTDVTCQARCLSNIGELCLIQRFKFSAAIRNITQPIWRAKFQTCLDARIDLSLKDIFIELRTDEMADAEFAMVVIGKTDAADVQISRRETISLHEKHSLFIGRVSADQMLNSGSGLVDLEFSVPSCSGEHKSNDCKISGTIEAVTDPNIRCELIDKTKPGAYLEQRNSINRDPPILLSPYTFN